MAARIVEFDPSDRAHREAFRALNEWWIKKWFKIEPADTKALDNPEQILAGGGLIILAEVPGPEKKNSSHNQCKRSE